MCVGSALTRTPSDPSAQPSPARPGPPTYALSEAAQAAPFTRVMQSTHTDHRPPEAGLKYPRFTDEEMRLGGGATAWALGPDPIRVLFSHSEGGHGRCAGGSGTPTAPASPLGRASRVHGPWAPPGGGVAAHCPTSPAESKQHSSRGKTVPSSSGEGGWQAARWVKDVQKEMG